MKQSNQQITCAQANEIDLVNYLERLGYHPCRVRRADYWYLSPLRKERTASFKVNRKLNRWYDHGIAEGGSLVDFGLKYFGCSIPELLAKLSAGNIQFAVPRLTVFRESQQAESQLQIVDTGPLQSVQLLRYLKGRGIDSDVAKNCCCQVVYTFGKKSYQAIGFPNDQGGYELRQPLYKYSSSPKGLSTFDLGFKEVAIFEGFMDYLSYLSFHQGQALRTNMVVLNGIGLFERARAFIEKHQRCSLYLDRDAAGMKTSSAALKLSYQYQDQSGLYKGFKDMNEWWMMREDHPGKYYRKGLKI